VTGHDENGKAIFVSDEEVEPVTAALMPGTEFSLIWGGDEPPTYPDAGETPGLLRFFPPLHGFRFYILTAPPDAEGVPPEGLDMEAAMAEIDAKLPGMIGHIEVDDPGMHTTATADFEVMLAGEITLELDDGSEKVMRPGDTIIQNGTRHRWHNRTDKPATFAVFIIGAHHNAKG
jgi:hypothetical protein